MPPAYNSPAGGLLCNGHHLPKPARVRRDWSCAHLMLQAVVSFHAMDCHFLAEGKKDGNPAHAIASFDASQASRSDAFAGQ